MPHRRRRAGRLRRPAPLRRGARRRRLEVLIVHARKAWLHGLSPKENREIPPLNYPRVYQLKREFPQLTIVINGGIVDATRQRSHLQHVDGVMLGRAAYHDPYVLAQIEHELFGTPLPERDDVLARMKPYIDAHIARRRQSQSCRPACARTVSRLARRARIPSPPERTHAPRRRGLPCHRRRDRGDAGAAPGRVESALAPLPSIAMIVTSPAEFLSVYSPERFPATAPATARAAFLVAPNDFSLAAESARDNRYMAMQAGVDAARALGRARRAGGGAARMRADRSCFPAIAATPDAVFPNNVFATAPGRADRRRDAPCRAPARSGARRHPRLLPRSAAL